MKSLGFPRQEYVTKKAKINEILSQLSEKFENAKKDLEDIGKRLTEVEAHFTQPPTPGIFTYIEEGSDQALFIEKIEEAIVLEMSTSQRVCRQSSIRAKKSPLLDQRLYS